MTFSLHKKINSIHIFQKDIERNLSTKLTLDDIKNDNYKPIPLRTVLQDYPSYELNANEYFKVKNGSKMSLNLDDKIVTLLYNNKPIALYRKENDIYRVYKMLEINTDNN